MQRLSFTYNTRIDFSEPVEDHYFVLRCLPTTQDIQVIEESHLELIPEAHYTLQRDGFGNTIEVGNINAFHTAFRYEVSGVATTDTARRRPETPHPMYLFPTTLTTPSSEIRRFLICQNVNRSAKTLTTCEQLSHAVHEFFKYRPGATSVTTTAAEAFDLGQGVCQDYAHVLIALLRSCNIPARYVSGLPVGEGTTHAWVQANLDGYWIGLDPTRDRLVDETYLTLAVGPDYADCPIERGTFLGNADQVQTVFMSVEKA